jgi:hypothetical protein
MPYAVNKEQGCPPCAADCEKDSNRVTNEA